MFEPFTAAIPTAEIVTSPDTVNVLENLKLFVAEFTVSALPKTKPPASTLYCNSESALNCDANGTMETTPEVEILDSVFAESSSNALALIVTAAEELRTSEAA